MKMMFSTHMLLPGNNINSCANQLPMGMACGVNGHASLQPRREGRGLVSSIQEKSELTAATVMGNIMSSVNH